MANEGTKWNKETLLNVTMPKATKRYNIVVIAST